MPTKNILLIILGVFIVIIVAFGAYSLGKNQNESKTPSNPVDNSTTTQPPKENSSCAVNLTSEEKKITKDWETYTSSKDGYTFMHPGDWEDVDDQGSSVIMTNDSALYSFQFGMVDEPHGGFLEESKEDVVVACENTQKQSLAGQPPGGENFRREVTQFTKDGKEYTAILSFRFVDKSTSKNLKETYDLILKTIEFN